MRIQTVFKSTGRLRQLLMNVKTPTPEMSRKEVVYQIPCQDCAIHWRDWQVTIGKRKTGHKHAVKIGDQKNEVAVHAWDEGHRVDWEGAKILESEPHYLKRRVVEAIWMKKTSRNWNLNCALVRLGSQTLNEHMTFPSLIFVNFSFPPINHLNLAIINPCLYQPISVLYCAPSPHLANEGLRTKMSCTAVANFHAMLGYKRSLNHCSQHNNEPL